MDARQKVRAQQFPNLGYLSAEVPLDLMDLLRVRVAEVQADFGKAKPKNEHLVGHLRKEFSLDHCKDEFERYLVSLSFAYDKIFHYLGGFNIFGKPADFELHLHLSSLWVNFQEKHEFNPPHNHSGVMSFVIWVQVPYDLEKEKLWFPDLHAGNRKASIFEFFYNSSLGYAATCGLEVDKTWEGKVVMFPAKLMHAVHPFYTSDDYRISVSGNIGVRA